MRTNSRSVLRLGPWLVATGAFVGWLAILPAAGWAQQGATADLFKQAQVYEDGQNYAAAEAIYRKVLASAPNDPEALKRLGMVEQSELKLDNSIEDFKHALSVHPGYSQVNFCMGLSYYDQHNYKDAIASFQQELRTPTAHPATRYYLALAMEGEGRMNDAIDQLNEVAAKNPNKADVFFELARLHMNASFLAFTQLRKIDPDSYQLHAFMGGLYSQEGHAEAAITQFQAALKKQPDAPGIHSLLGAEYFQNHQLDLAEKELLLAIKEAHDDALANLYLGDMALHLHKFSKALPYLQQAVAGRPQDVEASLFLARCYMSLEDPQHARDTLLLTAKIDPADPRSHYMLAEVYQKLNQPADRQRELDMFNKLSEAQKAQGAGGFGVEPAPPPGSNPQ